MRHLMHQLWFIAFLFAGQLLGQSNSKILTITKSFNETSLDQVFIWLENEYGIQVAFDEKAAQSIYINEDFENIALNNFFEQLLYRTELDFQQIQSHKYLVGPKHFFGSTDTISISGLVIDRTTQKPLSYASVFLTKNKTGTHSDENGQFTVNTNHLDDELVISYVGYEPQQIKLETVQSNLTVQLQQEISEFEAVTILEQSPALKMSQTDNKMQFDLEKISGLPVAVISDDIYRNIQLMPGISATDDLSAGIKVRGGSADENLILLDHMKLFNVNHFYGVFSGIHPDIVEKINIYKNNFPIEYSGYTSSVIEMKTHEKTQNTFSGALKVDLLTARLMIDVPIIKGMQITLAGRTTHQDIANAKIFDILQSNKTQLDELTNQDALDLDRPGLIEVTPSFTFNDVFAKWKWQLNPKNTFDFTFFRGYDKYNYNLERQFSFNNFRNFRVQNTETNQETSQWENEAWAFSYERKWTEKLSSNFIFNRSAYQLDNEQYFSLEQGIRLRNDTIRSTNLLQNNTIKSTRINWKNEWQNLSFGQLIFGYNYSDNNINLELTSDEDQLLNNSDIAQEHTIYGKQAIQFWDKLDLDIGLSATQYGKTNQFYYSPRLAVNFKLNDQLYFKSSWARYYQFLRQIYHEDPFGENQTFWILANGDQIPPINSRNLMLGAHLNLNSWVFDLEFYQKQSDGVVEYALLNPGARINPLNGTNNRIFTLFNGRGRSQGVDLLIQKSIENYTGWFTYTLSENTHTFGSINGGAPYPSQEDRRHQLKWVNQYEIGPWTFSGNYIFASGRPYVDIARVSRGSVDRRSPNFATNITRLRDYHRLDIGAEYQFNLFNQSSTIGFSILNLLNHNNVKYRQYAFTLEPSLEQNNRQNTVIGTELQLLDRIFNFSFGMKFGKK